MSRLGRSWSRQRTGLSGCGIRSTSRWRRRPISNRSERCSTAGGTLEISSKKWKISFQIDFGGEKSPIVGIDLGTTNSLVAVMELTGPRILSGIVPSVVSVTESGDVIAGAEARELLLTHPERTVYSVKRLMGRGVEDIQEELKLFPFHIAEGRESTIKLKL